MVLTKPIYLVLKQQTTKREQTVQYKFSLSQGVKLKTDQVNSIAYIKCFVLYFSFFRPATHKPQGKGCI